MITATFHMEGDRIVSFLVEGHSGLASSGEDILCAAVTSSVRLTECAVNDVLWLEASVKVRTDRASISLKLPGGLGQTNESTCQTLLAALMLHLTGLQRIRRGPMERADPASGRGQKSLQSYFVLRLKAFLWAERLHLTHKMLHTK